MRNEEFMIANKTFSGRLRKIKETGQCVKNTSKLTFHHQMLRKCTPNISSPATKAIQEFSNIKSTTSCVFTWFDVVMKIFQN